MTYKILIIEDDPEWQRRLRTVFEDYLSSEVHIVERYSDAIEKLKNATLPYDVISIDMNLSASMSNADDADNKPQDEFDGPMVLNYVLASKRGELCMIVSGESVPIDYLDHLVKFQGLLIATLNKTDRDLRNKIVQSVSEALRNRIRSDRKVFISYRRDDSGEVTGRIRDRLVRAFGEDTIWRDVDSIQLGVNFEKEIYDIIQSCTVMLVIIGKNWVDIVDEHNMKRLHKPDDYVRLEIETGMKRRLPILPILVQGVQMPQKAQLPPSLHPLTEQNAALVRRDPDFDADIQRIIASIKTFLQ